MNINLVTFCWILTVINWRSGLALPLDDSTIEKSQTAKENPPFSGPSFESSSNIQLSSDSKNLSESQTNPAFASGSINNFNSSLPSLMNEGNSNSLEKELSTEFPFTDNTRLTSTTNYGKILTTSSSLNDTVTISNINSMPHFTDNSNQFIKPDTQTTIFKNNENLSNLNFKGTNFTDIYSPAITTNYFESLQNTSTTQHVYETLMITQTPGSSTIGSKSDTFSDSQSNPSSIYSSNSPTDSWMKQNMTTENNVTSALFPSVLYNELNPLRPTNTSVSSISNASDTSNWILDMNGNPISLSPNDIFPTTTESSIHNNNSLFQNITTPFSSGISNKNSILPITLSPTSTNVVPKTDSNGPRTCTEWDGPEKTYTGPCDICRCIYGLVRCFNKDCPKAPAQNCIANLVEGKCCPVHDCTNDDSTQLHVSD